MPRASGPNSTSPRGSGSIFVTVRIRPDNAGVFVFIGRALDQQLGEPARVDLDAATQQGQWTITPGERYTVTNRKQNGQPRISVGRAWLEHIGLEAGEHIGRIDGNVLRFGHV